MSIFSNVVELPANIVLGLNAECVADPFPDKINLTIGAYRDDDGNPVVLNSVRDAETQIYNSKMDNGVCSHFSCLHMPRVRSCLVLCRDVT